MNKNYSRLLAICLIIFCVVISIIYYIKIPSIISDIKYILFKRNSIDKIVIDSDKDNDGILDLDDIVQGARKDAANKPKYKSVYYEGGYPPDNQGVCSDVVWRALKNAGYNLKDMIDKDIRENIEDYPRVGESPDPNIDFRRVKNLNVFFSKYADHLTLELKSGDVENLKEWQGGDIVIFKAKYDHIVIVSDKRKINGVPYIIHNSGPYTKEKGDLEWWMPYIVGHYRFPKE